MMPKPSVKEILSAPIALVRPSTDKEKEVFMDKKGGYFYTVGLASGQKFAAHIGEDKDKTEPTEVFTLRPLENLLPNLREIQWLVSRVFGGHGVATKCRLVPPVPKEEEQNYQTELSPKERWVTLNGLYKYNPQRVYDDHPMLDRLGAILSARQACEKAQKALFESQQKLKSLEILEEKGSSINTKQIIQNIRKEKTNG